MGILADKVAIVTGAGTGIGEGEAHALAKEAIRSLTRTAAREWGQYNINDYRLCNRLRWWDGDDLANT